MLNLILIYLASNLKGIYFADMVAKSSNYCGGYGTEFNNSKFMFLSEVALGKVQDVQINNGLKSDLLNNGSNSLKTCNSRYHPDPGSSVYWKGLFTFSILIIYL